MKILVSGAAGFIGRYVIEQLEADGHDAVSFAGDVRSTAAWERQLPGVGAICHLAARVGTGESMYRFESYCSTNISGTAAMIDAMRKIKSTARVVLASSSAVYGVGGRAISESRVAPAPSSVYGFTKLAQEQLLEFAEIPTAPLRLFGVYGPGQSLSNPYSGIVALLVSSLLANAAPVLYEDGNQLRDLIHVVDVARAFSMACTESEDWLAPTNIGTGVGSTIGSLAAWLRERIGGPAAEITGEKRSGDIRDSVADVRRASSLGWRQQVPLSSGLDGFCEWAMQQEVSRERPQEIAARELRARDLLT